MVLWKIFFINESSTESAVQYENHHQQQHLKYETQQKHQFCRISTKQTMELNSNASCLQQNYQYNCRFIISMPMSIPSYELYESLRSKSFRQYQDYCKLYSASSDGHGMSNLHKTLKSLAIEIVAKLSKILICSLSKFMFNKWFLCCYFTSFTNAWLSLAILNQQIWSEKLIDVKYTWWHIFYCNDNCPTYSSHCKLIYSIHFCWSL